MRNAVARELLPNRRISCNFTTSFAGEKYDVTVGFYPDGRIGETFVNRIRDKSAARLGEQLDGICRDSAILLSFALQYGAPLNAISRAVTRNDDNEPSTIVGALVELMEKLGTQRKGGGDAAETGQPRVPDIPRTGSDAVEPAI
jgi:hypothetical protein